MTNSEIRLHHFDERGRAEVSRLVLALAGKSYKDDRFTFKEWPQIKPTMPLGQAPVLEIDGIKYCQSLAIASYLAKEFGFYGQSNLHGLKIDMISQLVYEWRYNAANKLFGPDGCKKDDVLVAKFLTEEEAPKYLRYLDSLLKDNGGKFMVGDSVTLADLVVLDMFTGFVCEYIQAASSKFPLLKDLVDRVSDIPNIRKYIECRK